MEGAAFSLDFTKQNVLGSVEPIIPQLLIKKKRERNKNKNKNKKNHISLLTMYFSLESILSEQQGLLKL